MAGLLVAAGVGIGLHSYGALATALGGSARHVHDLAAAVGHAHAHGTDMHAAAVGIALASVIVKELLYRATIRVAAQTNSSLLAANAWHHRSDAFSSLVALGASRKAKCTVAFRLPSMTLTKSIAGRCCCRS